MKSDRSPEKLSLQAETFCMNLGAAKALGFILQIDPLFEKFMVEQCGLDSKKLQEISALLSSVVSLKNQNGLIDPANCKKFLESL